MRPQIHALSYKKADREKNCLLQIIQQSREMETVKKIILTILIICIFTTSLMVVQARDVQEIYLEDIRIVYADSYSKATAALKNTEFEDYKILDSNLNKGTGKKGVWLAYKTTTDIEKAITDISIMQMNGGYKEGNYREMIANSRKEYEAMGKIYIRAIEHMVNAAQAGDFLANAALRQLNFYFDPDSGKKIGDLFTEGISADALATLFFEGNKYALDNVRTLIAMGTAYNENGKNYLELVEEAAKEMTKDPFVFEYDNFDSYAVYVAAGIITFKTMFKEYETVKNELDYTDEETTELELKYMEYASLAIMFEEVNYLKGETLYEFCLNFKYNEDDLTSLYPLVAAMNDGQMAMTELAHYYDVVSYGSCATPEDIMDEKIGKLEEKYEDEPFDIYMGVDRSIYDGTFALTTEADRANASDPGGLLQHLLGYNGIGLRLMESAFVGIGISIISFNISLRKGFNKMLADTTARRSSELFAQQLAQFDTVTFPAKPISYFIGEYEAKFNTIHDAVNHVIYRNFSGILDNIDDMTFLDKYQFIISNKASLPEMDVNAVTKMEEIYSNGYFEIHQNTGREAAAATTREFAQTSQLLNYATVVMYIVGGAFMLAAAINLGVSIYNYYNPDYDDIPKAMVDLIEGADGDRYIKYDAVTMIDQNKDGDYDPADLNAFEGKYWNAMYITKSYEAGRPLLADFSVCYDNNTPAANFLPVHRFGEKVCYNLNKYNFKESAASIYLSVKQSDNQKAAVSDIPVVV